MISCSHWGMFEFPFPFNDYILASPAFMSVFAETLSYDARYLHDH